LRDPMAGKTKRAEFHISGFDCATCTKIIGKALEGLPGLREININYVVNRGCVDFDPEQISAQEIEDGLKAKTKLRVVRRKSG
jgi:Cu+-exporting ATPase